MSQVVRFKDLEKMGKAGLQQLGATHAQDLIDQGFVDPTVATVQVKKAIEYLNAYYKQLDYETRLQITRDPEGWKEIMGATLGLSSTGDRLDYGRDEEYQRIKKKLDNRKRLLDLAFRSDEEIYDNDGAQVPKVKIKTPSKEILKVSL